MFQSQNNLNEGTVRNKTVNKNGVLQEGKDPKRTEFITKEQNWQSAKKVAHVNSNWERLRK